MNKVFLIGRLTKEPELNTINDGTQVCRFSIAVSRQFKSASAPETDFFNIVAWRELGVNCNKYLVKGQQCAVSGRIETRNYTDSNGAKRTATDVIAEQVEFLQKPSDSPSSAPGEYGGRPQKQAVQARLGDLTPVDDENLPF